MTLKLGVAANDFYCSDVNMAIIQKILGRTVLKPQAGSGMVAKALKKPQRLFIAIPCRPTSSPLNSIVLSLEDRLEFHQKCLFFDAKVGRRVVDIVVAKRRCLLIRWIVVTKARYL